MRELIENVVKWADEKSLLHYDNAPKQFMKIIEEFGETSGAILKKDSDKIKDGLGDLMVTIIIYSYQLGRPLQKWDYQKYDSLKVEETIKSLCLNIVSDSIHSSFRQVCELAYELGFTPKECLQAAWDEIKDRKGKTVNGTFIKESDLV